MRVLVCGDRNWTDKVAIFRELSKLPKDSVIIQGECKGADSLGKLCAIELQLQVVGFPANWTKYGIAAGPIRNKQMLIEGKPDQVWAFHGDITHSKGTKNMLGQAKSKGILCKIFTA